MGGPCRSLDSGYRGAWFRHVGRCSFFLRKICYQTFCGSDPMKEKRRLKCLSTSPHPSYVETIFGKRDLTIRASAASSVSRLAIPFTLTVRADRARRDRKSAILPDRLHEEIGEDVDALLAVAGKTGLPRGALLCLSGGRGGACDG